MKITFAGVFLRLSKDNVHNSIRNSHDDIVWTCSSLFECLMILIRYQFYDLLLFVVQFFLKQKDALGISLLLQVPLHSASCLGEIFNSLIKWGKKKIRRKIAKNTCTGYFCHSFSKKHFANLWTDKKII